MDTAVRDTVKIEPRAKVGRSQTGYVSLPRLAALSASPLIHPI